MSELNDLFEMENGDFSSEDYLWEIEIPIPEHPLGKLRVRGISEEHCAEKLRDCLYCHGWDKWIDPLILVKATKISK